MNKSVGVAAVVVLVAALGEVGVLLGVTVPVFTLPAVSNPTANQDWFSALFNAILGPLVYMFNAFGSFVQIVSFQVSGIPPILTLGIDVFMAYTFWRLVRGGG